MKKTFLLLIFCFLSFAVSYFGQEARKVDEFGFTNCETLRLNLDVFLNELYELKETKGYIFVYEGRLLIRINNQKSKTVYPRYGEAKATIKMIKDHIKFRGFEKSRIVFINGGFRDMYTTELWIVPLKATPPTPSPTLKKMKYRNGKAKDFCGEF